MSSEQPPAKAQPKRPRRRLQIGLGLAVVAVALVVLMSEFRAGQPGPESAELKPIFDALQMKWPDPMMRVGRRQLGARRAVVAWFVSDGYVYRAKTEKDALAADAIDVARRALPPNLDATHVCVVFANERHAGIAYGSASEGSCSTR